MTWDPVWDEAAKAIVHDVMAEPLPALKWSYSGSSGGEYFAFVDRPEVTVGGRNDTAETIRPIATDERRRKRVAELVQERGWPTEVRDLAWLLLPYLSVRHRWGHEAERAIRDGRTEAAIEARARAWLARFLVA